VTQQWNIKGEEVDTPLYRYKNVIAGPTCWYWGEADIMDLWN
jgi:cobyrinic acid a,c-diamide synthase